MKIQHDIDKVVASWISHSLSEEINNEHFWAFEAVDDLVKQQPEQAWDIIVELVNNCPNDQVLANIAAGPLEDLLYAGAAQFIDRIENFAAESDAFRKCLTGVDNISPWEVYQRVVALTERVDEPL